MDGQIDVLSEVHGRLSRALCSQGGMDCEAQLSCCVPLLVDLLFEFHNEPIEHMTTAVRRVIIEHCVVDEGGDALTHDTHAMEAGASLIMEELSALRQELLDSGQWSEQPVPPLMCG